MAQKSSAFEEFIDGLPGAARKHGLALRVTSAKTDEGGRAVLFAIEEGIMYNDGIDIIDKEFIDDVEDSLEQNIRSKPKRINFSLTPEVRAEFETIAKRHGISLTEMLRRAAFAVKHDPTLLHVPEVESDEAAYKTSLGPSRWTRENG